MSVKTTYKNDMFAGPRKYKVTQNDDGTISLEDVTEYTQDGDILSAEDMNNFGKAINQNSEDIATTNKNVDDLKSVKYATFTAGNWSSSQPYTQTVSVSGIKSTDAPVISLYIPSGTSAANAKAQGKAYGYVDRGVTGNGSLTLQCFNSKPGTTFQVIIKGD